MLAAGGTMTQIIDNRKHYQDNSGEAVKASSSEINVW